MKRIARPERTPARVGGFSLVELMVGMTIALVMFLVIAQVYANFENQKRLTTLSSDTQSSGMMAMFEMEQAIRSAGAGIVSEDTFDCVPGNTYSYYTTAGPPAVETTPVPGYGQFFAPVVITNGAGNASDTLEVRIGAPVANSVATEAVGGLSKFKDPELLQVRRGLGFPVGTVLLIFGPVSLLDPTFHCAAVEVTAVPNSTEPNVMSIAPAASGNTWNPTVAYRIAKNWPEFSAAPPSYVVAPGAVDDTTGALGGMYFHTYSVNSSGQLQVVQRRAGKEVSTDVLAADVVRFHAQYGVSSAPGVQDINRWVEPVQGGSYETDWDPGSLDANKVKRIKAIRLVFVMRSPKLEATNVTGTCTNKAGVNNGPCAWEDTGAAPVAPLIPDVAPLIDLSNDPNWRRYRYRVFQTIVPLRNTIAAGV